MLKRLIKESFELWCEMNWLKAIDKELKKRDKCYEMYKRHDYVATELLEEYNKLTRSKANG